MFNIKLGQAIPAHPDRILSYVSKAAEAQGLQIKLLYEEAKTFKVVKNIGSDISAIKFEEFTEVKFFKEYWFSDSKFDCSMCLIDGKYWCHAWAYFDAEYAVYFDIKPIFDSSALSFEEMERIENKLLARAS